ncbi:MAG TPA: hypothetical protein VHY79_19495 [Rhizomicrobium sp.]|jgi:hypothetical protein|nr:hypothetical protein [Rhizomicrobium sp.]
MNKRLTALALLAASVALPGMASAGSDPRLANLPELGKFKPMFLVGPKHSEPLSNRLPTAQLPQWNGSYTDLTGKNVTFTQIGGNPSNTNATSTINVLLIPVKFVITQNGTKYTFDPMKVKLANNFNRNVITAMKDSPLFNSKVDFNPQYGSCNGSCVDLGKTQYEDAFQRGTWWGNDVQANTDYHVLFTTTVEKEQTITASCTSGCVVKEGNLVLGEYNFGQMDREIQTMLSSIKDVNPGVLPLFISYDVYLTSGGCCIGGYHDADGRQPTGQTYSYATYVDSAGEFSQDVSAFSHELGEWMDDPFVDNFVNCNDNGIMEVGDPLEGQQNYGGFPYKDKKFTYNLQSLVYMGYFGAPTTDSANQWLALQDDETHVCPGQ